MIYYVVLGILVLLALPIKNRTRGLRVGVGVLMILVLGGLRFEVGTDWFAYKELFDAITLGEPFSTFREENGFLTLALSVSSIGGGYAVFVLATFALALATKVWAIERFGVDVNAALITYFSAIFLIYDINGLRQGLALGFVMLAAWAAYRGMIWRFAFGMLAALSMHMIALVALPLWTFTRRWFYLKDRHNRIALLFAACLVCYATAGWLASSDLSNYLALVNLADRYDHYVDEFDTAFNPLGPGSIQRLVVATVIAVMIDAVQAPARLKTFLYNVHAASLLVYFLFSFNIEFMARLSFYFKCLDIVTLSLIFGAQTTLRARFFFLAFLSALCFAQLFQILSIPDGGLIPYKMLLGS
jgi:hypothetical protein